MSARQDISQLRVILVGRSPIESQLRRDAAIDLIRARTTLDAIGELGLSDVTGDLTPVVVLSPDAVDDSSLGESIRAMVRTDPRVRIVGVHPVANGHAAHERPGSKVIRLWLDESNGPGHLRELLSHESPVAPPSRMVHETPPQAPRRQLDAELHAPFENGPPARSPEPAVAATASSEFLITDEGILGTLLTGGDILAPCLDHLRRRFRPDEIEFHWSKDDSDALPEAHPGCTRVTVEHRGRRFAWLVGPSASERELAQAANWLAHWLAVREQHSQLRSAAFTDPLTGAWNRRYLDRFLPMAIDRARQKRHDVTLLLFDIDNFKHYNDTYGHPAGDEILIETVQLLNSVIRPTDRVTRIGGDEFAVIFDDPEGPRDPRSHHPASIFEIAKRFQRQINDHRFPKLGECARGSLSISGGLATFPWDASDADALIERADRLILDSKRGGKNVICIGPGAQQALGGCGGLGGRLSPSAD